MQKATFEWMLFPVFIITLLAGYLYFHEAHVKMALNAATFEGQIQAAENGRYTEDIYSMIKDYLQTAHNYDRDLIEISGTESLTTRGDYLYIEIEVPKPLFTKIPLFNMDSESSYTVERRIMSEYIP